MTWNNWYQIPGGSDSIKGTHGGLGFQDRKMFNQVLLAREAWRLIQFLHNLVARLLKAKYYLNSNLLDTA
jgi:hypothetical protein